MKESTHHPLVVHGNLVCENIMEIQYILVSGTTFTVAYQALATYRLNIRGNASFVAETI
eukprot:m.270682 g.270682  ORF g.270682 m.270682 type:complete len:59 (+) comp16085_c0_seq10:418-594(+)